MHELVTTFTILPVEEPLVSVPMRTSCPVCILLGCRYRFPVFLVLELLLGSQRVM